MSGIVETEYRDYIIRRKKYEPAAGEPGCMGFHIEHVYVVEDEFGEPGLPEILQQVFWSPADAAQAIDFRIQIGPYIDKNQRTWPTTLAYEFNNLLRFRRNAVYLLQEMNAMRTRLDECLDGFGDEPSVNDFRKFLNDLYSCKHRIAGS